MAELIARQVIDNVEAALEDVKRRYLQKFGWEHTCNTPGAYWLWRRDFAAEDAARHARWKEAGPGRYGWPSEPRPYGVITAETALAVSITKRALDEEIDQDGDPETPAFTEADFVEG